MPLPSPKPFERQDDFVTRCIGEVIEKDNLPRDQATAICYTQWSTK